MKTMISRLAMVCGAVFLIAVMAGCRTSGHVASEGTSATCPQCKAATAVVPCKDVAYNRAVCPDCGKVTTFSPTLRDAVRSYVGTTPSGPVHVCHACKCVVETCPACGKQ